MRKTFVIIILSLILLYMQTTQLLAQDAEMLNEDFFDILFADEEAVQVSIASIKSMSIKEAPGIVTRIDAREIKNSGARDLIDVLRLVAGINFGVDVQGAVGIGMRGNWGHEGKILLLVDGLEFNERLYCTLQFGNHFSVDQIKHIEMIRGPGSPLYGGYAELAVINIVTKEAEDIKGISINGTYGLMKDTFARRNITLDIGKSYKDLKISASLFMGEGNRSDQNFTDFWGDTYNMKDNAELNPFNINLSLKYKGLSTRFIFDNYRTTERDAYDTNETSAMQTDFPMYLVDLKYELKINNTLSVTPRFDYKRQYPWKLTDKWMIENDALFANVRTERFKTGFIASYDPGEKFNVIFGSEYIIDQAKIMKNDPEQDHFNGKPDVSYKNYNIMAQALYYAPFANVTAGIRYDKHEQYGSSTVPRLALTKVMDKLSFKILGSRAFRAPGIENINSNFDIKPEKTTVFEIETGYQLSEKSSISINCYDITIDKPIVFFYEEGAEGYRNYDKTGTRGVEMHYKYTTGRGYIFTNYSYYQAHNNSVQSYEVAVDDKLLLAMPAHKITLNSSYKLMSSLRINPSATYLSKRYGYKTVDDEGIEFLEEFDPVLLINVYLSYSEFLTKQLEIGFGIFDILDEKYAFLQPYNNWHAPLPGPSREYVLKLTYNFHSKE